MKQTVSSANALSRRRFLAATAATVAAPYIIPASARGAAGRPAPSNRIVIGCVGVGGQGNSNLGGFLGSPECQVIAVADVDKKHAEDTKNRIDKSYGNQDCKAYGDFREVTTRPDIDAISLATPDHWHALVALSSAKHGKDIYGEKPFSHDLLEGRAMVNAVNQYGRIWQTGSWQRSTGDFRRACELVRNGYIGKVLACEVGLPTGGPGGMKPFKAPPPEMDYDMWCGPAPFAPYSDDRTHWNWRWQLDYGGGQMMDWIGHHGDIGQWGLDTEHTGPVEMEPINSEWPQEGIWNAPTTYRAEGVYANGVKLVIANSGNGGVRSGTKWIGDKGWVWVDRGGFDTEPKELKQVKIGPNQINLYKSTNHIGNFIECVKSRRPTIAPAEVAHRSASLGHLAMVALNVGRKIRWNPQTEQIIGDEPASRLLGRAKREPWNLA
jgi:predicted dehydrogenase